MFVVWSFKSINWEHVEFDEGKSQFLPFLVVYHILSETETWPVRLLPRIYSSEMQYKLGIGLQINSEWKNWIGCYFRPNLDMSMVWVLLVSTFATELDLTR